MLIKRFDGDRKTCKRCQPDIIRSLGRGRLWLFSEHLGKIRTILERNPMASSIDWISRSKITSWSRKPDTRNIPTSHEGWIFRGSSIISFISLILGGNALMMKPWSSIMSPLREPLMRTRLAPSWMNRTLVWKLTTQCFWPPWTFWSAWEGNCSGRWPLKRKHYKRTRCRLLTLWSLRICWSRDYGPSLLKELKTTAANTSTLLGLNEETAAVVD